MNWNGERLESSIKPVRFHSSVESGNCLIIIDYNFWNDHEEELARWLLDNTEKGLYTREGMCLYFSSQEEMSWFLLRWA